VGHIHSHLHHTAGMDMLHPDISNRQFVQLNGIKDRCNRNY
jgi:hypothetical protein